MPFQADRARTTAVALLGAALLALAYALHGIVDLAVHDVAFLALYGGALAVCAAACALLWRRARRVDLAIVLAVALLARLLLAFDAPTLSDDAYRFVWDGRVQAAGINPYDHPPAAPALRPLRDYVIFTQVNRPYTRTGYPPVNELAFVAVNRVSGEGTTNVKLALVAVEAIVVALLLAALARMGASPGRVALYAWHPLAIVEVASSGHPEPLLAALVLAALLAWDRGRALRAGAALGAAVLTKFVPLLLGPMMARRLGARFALAAVATCALLLAPYAAAGTAALGSLGAYSHERFGSGPYRWLTGVGVSDSLTRALLACALAAAVAWTAARPPRELVSGFRYAALLLGGALLASFNVQPWYLLWVLPLLCIAPVGALLWATATVPALYLVFGPGARADAELVSALVWGPPVALLVAGVIRSWFPRARTAVEARAGAREPARA